MEIFLYIIGTVLVLVGIIGSIAPGVPGPPLAYVALLILEWSKDSDVFSTEFLVVLGVITLVVTIVENLLPLAGARIYGASRQGMWGAVIGLVAGIFVFPPFGLIFGVLIGAVAGELLAGRNSRQAWRAGLATFAGNMASIFLKLALSFVIAYYFFTSWL